MKLRSRLPLITFAFVLIGFSYTHAAPIPTSKTTTIVYTSGLGAYLRDPSKADRSRCDAIAKRLKELRARYSDAICVDGGDAIGPMVANESPFGLPVYRIFDESRFAAAALSARDGVQTFGFARIMPVGAKIKTPLIGTFDLPKSPPGLGGFYEIHPAWATAETSAGAKFQIFGVATTTSLSGVVEPLSGIKTGGTAAEQAQYVLDHLQSGHIPLILSDMTPTENDEFARLFNRNALLFEGGYPWRLAIPPADLRPNRDIGPVRILSHFAPNVADVVALPPSLECRKAQLIRSEPLWEPQRPPAEGGFRLLGGKPIETRLIHSPYADTLYLADVGTSVGKRSLLGEIMLPYDDKDVLRIPPVGQSDWRPPRWMERTRHLRGNEVVYRYDLYFHKNFTAHVYRIRHFVAPPYSVFDMLVAVDKDHRIQKFGVFYPPKITNCQLRIDPLCRRLVGKRCDEIKLEDWPERGGAEFVIDNFVRDVQMLLAFDEAGR
jgi:hypothetical protein